MRKYEAYTYSELIDYLKLVNDNQPQVAEEILEELLLRVQTRLQEIEDAITYKISKRINI